MILSNYLTPTNQKRLLLLKEKVQESSLSQTVVSNSMAPAIKSGDQIEISSEEIKTGDVAAFLLASGDIMAHRVLGITDGLYILRGDNSGWFELAHPEMLVGRVASKRKLITSLIRRIAFKLHMRKRPKLLIHDRFISSIESNTIRLFDIFSLQSLRLVRELEQLPGKNYRCETVSTSTMMPEEALKTLQKSFGPFDEETISKSFFLARRAQLPLDREFDALVELLELRKGRSREEAICDIMTICKMKIMPK